MTEKLSLREKTNMFMIHPGAAGCEVYTQLANRLSNYFDCYGVESYNIYHTNKINNLTQLANYYLSYIDKLMSDTKQNTYNLLGWSLGGQIALEIAGILEKNGITKIRLYLIDTILIDNKLESLGTIQDIEKRKKRFINHIIEHQCGHEYIDRILPNIIIDMTLGQQTISHKLVYSKILLFKAMLQDQTISEIMVNSEEINQYLSTLKYNNIDKVVQNISNIKLVEVKVDHSNMLNELDSLTYGILSWLDNTDLSFGCMPKS